MKVNKIDNETSFCPLLNSKICQGECYEIQMVREEYINEKALNFYLDKELANKLCDNCLYNQLPNK